MSFLRFLLIAAAIFFVLPHFLLRKMTGKFTLSGISSQLEYNAEWETPKPSQQELEHLKTVFQQKFTYLDCGKQCFAFLSEDSKHVLKFFRMNLRRLPAGLMYIPLPDWLNQWREKTVAFKQSKLKRDFDSYTLAYKELRQEAGLLFVHLNKSDYLNQTVTIVDKIGIEHKVSLDEKEFLVQKGLTLAYEAIDELVAKGDRESAQKRVEAVLDLTMARYQKGIYDDDAYISKNYGFDGEIPILLDIGHFKKRPEYTQAQVNRKDFELITNRFKVWLEKCHPELVDCLEKKKEALYPL